MSSASSYQTHPTSSRIARELRALRAMTKKLSAGPLRTVSALVLSTAIPTILLASLVAMGLIEKNPRDKSVHTVHHTTAFGPLKNPLPGRQNAFPR